eukprot:3473943-Ditylum_brightwellii.AAC.1
MVWVLLASVTHMEFDKGVVCPVNAKRETKCQRTKCFDDLVVAEMETVVTATGMMVTAHIPCLILLGIK